MTRKTGHRILVVEDEPGLRQAYRIVLDAHGYSVTTAADGQQALVKLHEHKPDLILLDMLMPTMDGLGFIQAAHLAEDYPDTHVIAFSNLSDSNRLDEIRRLGVKHQVLKADISPSELVDMVAQSLKKTAK